MDSSSLHFPLRITRIEPQKNDAQRISLFHENTFIAGVSLSAWLVSGLSVGDVLSKRQFEHLEQAEQHEKVRTYLLTLLARRMHSKGELQQKAVRKGFEKEIVLRLIEEFEEKKWVDDQQFCEAFIRDKSRLSGWGPAKIGLHLQQKGVSASIISSSLSTMLEPVTQISQIVELVEKQRKRFLRETDELKRKQKVYRYLLAKGFSPSSILEQLGSLMQRLSHD